MFEKIIEFLTHEKFIQTVIAILVLFVIYFIFKTIFNKFLIIHTKRSNVDIKKFNTLKTLIMNIIKYLLVFLGVLIILNAVGIPVATLIASLGIVGAVVGLSLQDTLKDFISGIFIVMENQFSVGDTIEVDGFKGEVIFLGLKTTRIKKYTGEIKIIANRNITEVINYSISNSLAIVDISVAYEEDIEKIESVLSTTIERLNNEIKELKGKIEILGIEKLDESSVVFRVTALTKSMQHFAVQRKLLKEIKIDFDKNNIKIPYPQVEVHNGTKL